MRSDVRSGCPRRAPEDVSRACCFDFVENFTMDDFDQFERQSCRCSSFRRGPEPRAFRAGDGRPCRDGRHACGVDCASPGHRQASLQPLAARCGRRHRRPGDRRRAVLNRTGQPIVGGPTPSTGVQPRPSKRHRRSELDSDRERTRRTISGPDLVWFPRSTGAWIATGTMGTPRYGHTAVRLLDGRVLVAGGSGANNETT